MERTFRSTPTFCTATCTRCASVCTFPARLSSWPFRWIWENIDHFDASKFNFVVTDWDNVLGTKGYRVLDNVFYNDKHADDEEWLNPSGFTLMDPIVIDLEDVRREIEEELKGTADYGR